MKDKLRKAVWQAVNAQWPEIKIKKEDIKLDYPPENLGDYSCSVAMKLAGMLKKKPMEIADQLAEWLNNNAVENIEKAEAVQPGFLNFYLSAEYLQSLAEKINEEKEKYGELEPEQKEKIILEFVSANPTGPIHLGNGRGGPFGDTLANVLEKAGYEIWREYYVNDFGNQVKILGHSILKDDEAEYKGDYIDELSKKNKLKDPFEAGQWAAGEIIEKIIKPSMEKLGIEFGGYFSEKSLHQSGEVEKIFSELKEKDLIYEKDGAVWFKAEQRGDEKDRVIKKSTGEITYFGTDIAYHKNKFTRGFDRAINVWGADHHGDVKRVLSALEALGYKDKLEIILTQMVKVIKDGQELRMSKRRGTYISMDDLIEEAGKDAVRFFFLMYSNNTHINFNIDLAKEKSEKNPVFYVQYAHARICSIIKKVQSSKFKVQNKPEQTKFLKHPKEQELLKHLNKFPELIVDMAAWREVHHLPVYLISLADKFHGFYDSCRVIDEKNQELTEARLGLAKAVKIVLTEGLRLMGVTAPERM